MFFSDNGFLRFLLFINWWGCIVFWHLGPDLAQYGQILSELFCNNAYQIFFSKGTLRLGMVLRQIGVKGWTGTSLMPSPLDHSDPSLESFSQHTFLMESFFFRLFVCRDLKIRHQMISRIIFILRLTARYSGLSKFCSRSPPKVKTHFCRLYLLLQKIYGFAQPSTSKWN